MPARLKKKNGGLAALYDQNQNWGSVCVWWGCERKVSGISVDGCVCVFQWGDGGSYGSVCED